MTETEIADALGISERTILRDWEKAASARKRAALKRIERSLAHPAVSGCGALR